LFIALMLVGLAREQLGDLDVAQHRARVATLARLPATDTLARCRPDSPSSP
jgi:hypothetical protein